MNDDVLLTLHCPQCRQITEVVSEGENLVCLDCGWRFDDQITARILNPASAGDFDQPASENSSC
jgi:hypothetical protein